MKARLTRRRFVAAGGALAAAALLAACGSRAAPTAPPAETESKPAAPTRPATPAAASPAKPGSETRLRMAWWGGEARAKKWNQALDLYESKNPVKISRETAEFNPYWEKMNTQMAGGNPPDVINM